MVEIHDAPALARFILHGPATTACGLPLPQTPCQAVETGSRAALWRGPQEWLLLAPAADGPAIVAALAGQAVDVSDASVALLVEGPGAARLLNAGCPLDLHATVFPPGMATRTVLDRIGIVLWRRGPESWHLEIGRSYAGYARAYLAEAVRGLPGY